MLDAQFAINARVETVAQSFRRTLRPWGFLVPPASLTRRLKLVLEGFVARGVPLVVDNGHFDDITRIAKQLAGPISDAQNDLAALEARLKRTAVWRDLTQVRARKRQDLAIRLGKEAQGAQGMSLPDRRALATCGVIGDEDITGALWLRAGLDSPPMPRVRAALRKRNEAVARAASATVSLLPPKVLSQYLPVASALDYDSAFDAGRSFGAAGLTGAAMGFGAFMADNSFTDRIVVRGRSYALSRPLPMRYLRTALVARGFWDGWKEASDIAPRRFHFLGLGAPIMIPLAALAARGTPLLTFDATSPIRDAVEGTVYSSLGAYLKIRTRRLAERLVSGQLRSWNCPCGFCRAFVREHPFDYELGRKWGKSRTANHPIVAKDLQPSGALFKAYPLLAEPRGGEPRKAVSFARSGHNHWVVSEVMRDLRKHGKRRITLEKHIQRIVDEYKQATSSSYFSEAVSLGLDIVTGRLPK